jgi:hypothetical protein
MYSSLKTLVQRNMFHALYPDESHAKLPHKVTANCLIVMWQEKADNE